MSIAVGFGVLFCALASLILVNASGSLSGSSSSGNSVYDSGINLLDSNISVSVVRIPEGMTTAEYVKIVNAQKQKEKEKEENKIDSGNKKKFPFFSIFTSFLSWLGSFLFSMLKNVSWWVYLLIAFLIKKGLENKNRIRQFCRKYSNEIFLCGVFGFAVVFSRFVGDVKRG